MTVPDIYPLYELVKKLADNNQREILEEGHWNPIRLGEHLAFHAWLNQIPENADWEELRRELKYAQRGWMRSSMEKVE